MVASGVESLGTKARQKSPYLGQLQNTGRVHAGKRSCAHLADNGNTSACPDFFGMSRLSC